MQTSTIAHFKSASSMDELEDGTVDLVVTSPPYPMIEMWDEMFEKQDPAVGAALKSGDGQEAFDLMHAQLLPVWKECFRVVRDGGLACINVGDATRRIGDCFQLFPNHVRITEVLREIGFRQLPGILWRKPSNSLTKFMGSGLLGLNAYVTLEHEHILVFRKGKNRTVSGAERERRRESAYFWEERNAWFSDVWTDLRGTRQHIANGHAELRDRSAAFPLELPLRLIDMYSIYEDTVLDPFWGTGTTSLAATMLGRNSVGYETDAHFWPLFEERMEKVSRLSCERNRKRIEEHVRLMEERCQKKKPPKHESAFYGFSVVTRQERGIKFYDVERAERTAEHAHRCTYRPHVLRQRDALADAG